jgi:hypothetical protein
LRQTPKWRLKFLSLAHLPLEDEGDDTPTPDVRRLIGIGAGEADREGAETRNHYA